MKFKYLINSDKTSLGIELGSTRIKSVLISDLGEVIATGYYEWENLLVDGVWSYNLDDVWLGIQASYKQLKDEVKSKYNITLEYIGSIGISAMMHGYLVFDENNTLLTPFRTWRNAMTQEAEKHLTKLLNHNIPQRWSCAHLYQAILNKEKHVNEINYITTLAGYVHWKLTGEKVLGIGDASGMFPIDSKVKDYNQAMLKVFNEDTQSLGFNINLEEILPKVLNAGQLSGTLKADAIIILDPELDLKEGIKFAPPEGDAGTGMVATNAIKENTGNISAGTSVFAMIVLEDNLSKVYPEIDIVVTPSGLQVAMVHVNNCTSEINSWVSIFKDFTKLLNINVSSDELYKELFETALNSDEGLEGILSYGYHSGENITHIQDGRPLLVRLPDSRFTLSNLMRSLLDSAFATLNIGLNLLFEEGIRLNSIVGHGGIFKTEGVVEKIVASAVKSPVKLMETANEGGAWGMAILAAYVNYAEKMSLKDYLDNIVFKEVKTRTYVPSAKEINDYAEYVRRYQSGLEIENVAQNFK